MSYQEMARVNADWGDVKALREVLGLPKVPRPFKIIRPKGTEIVRILETSRNTATANETKIKNNL